MLANVVNRIVQNTTPYLETAVKALAANVPERITDAAKKVIVSVGNTPGVSQAITDRAADVLTNVSTSSDSSFLAPVLFASSVALGLLVQKSNKQAREKVSADEVKEQRNKDVLGFTNSVKKFFGQMESPRGICITSYKKFINNMSSKYTRLKPDEMNTIAVDEFNKKLSSEQKSTLITQLTNHNSIEQEASERKRALQQAKVSLLNKESELAGSRRFNGTIDRAWKSYFDARKDFLKALSPLCRVIKNKEPQLSQHESNLLRTLKPSSKNGKKELKKMEKGLFKMVTGRDDSSLADIISRARDIQGTNTDVQNLLAKFEKMNQAFEKYQALDQERVEIAGFNVNPITAPAEAGSKLEEVDLESNSVDIYFDKVKQQRNNRATFIETMSSLETLNAQFNQ